MTTEQYQIGYEAGYSDGFDAGAKSSPVVQQAQVRRIGLIHRDKSGHPYARLTTAFDEFGNGWQEGQEFAAIPHASPVVQHPLSEDDIGDDCGPNHLCKGRMIHLPTGEACDRCGFDGGQQ